MGKSYSSIAGMSLLVAGTGFVTSLPWQGTLAGGIVHSACEAALVGGIADWYAVTALFRHPLGQKWVPHTAIIPKNRERIIDGIVDMVENQWLTKEIIREKIETISILKLIEPYLNNQETRGFLTNWLADIIQKLVAQVDAKELAQIANDFLKTEGAKVPLTPHLANLLEWAKKNSYDEDLFKFLYQELQKMAADPKFKPFLSETISNGVNDFINGGAGGMMVQLIAPLVKNLNFDDFAASLQKMILQFLGDQTDNYQKKFQDFVSVILVRLETDPELSKVIENWKEDALSKISFTQSLEKLIVSVQNSDWLKSSSLLEFLNKLIDKEISNWMENPVQAEKLESWVKEQISHFVEQKHDAIGKLVRENLEKLSKEDFVDIIEEKVGSDLQWIRVNGAVVGGTIGVILHLLKLFI